MKARSAKQKGTRLEVEVVRAMQERGLSVRRQPGSGIYSDFPHDVELHLHEKRLAQSGF